MDKTYGYVNSENRKPPRPGVYAAYFEPQPEDDAETYYSYWDGEWWSYFGTGDCYKQWLGPDGKPHPDLRHAALWYKPNSATGDVRLLLP